MTQTATPAPPPAPAAPGEVPFLIERPVTIDAGLPTWARRTDPIVRRHLGVYWKTMGLDPAAYARIVGWQAAFVLASFAVPALFSLIMPAVTVSLVAVPIALAMHAGVLVRVATAAAASVADERRNDSLDLLRLSPRPAVEIVYSKIAAAVWREMENLQIILYAIAWCSLPLLIVQADLQYGGNQHPTAMRLGVLAALVVSVVRPVLETAMVGAIGAVCGAAGRWRMSASASAVVLGVAYFAAINGLRLGAWGPAERALIEYALPLAAPVFIIVLCTRLAARLLEREG